MFLKNALDKVFYTILRNGLSDHQFYVHKSNRYECTWNFAGVTKWDHGRNKYILNSTNIEYIHSNTQQDYRVNGI